MQEGYIKTLLTGIRRWANGKLATKVDSSTVTSIWSGTQQEYDDLQSYDNNTLYIIK